ncbi:MAG TPA: Hrp-dependent type III effector protein [Streptomyces sp.]|nr:Hrp-dependent type III effector protein [Streptomyces sp.]
MPRFAFLADDLTGASDVLAQAHAHGLNAVLVLDPDHPLPHDADVVGIASPIRSQAGTELDASVRAGLVALAALEVEALLYKVCSTFDSSPTVGNIGRAVELLHEQFPDHGSIPVVPAQPGFGRFTAFSQHFAAYAGGTYRLDRHPVMSRHPSTPMVEADLRRVLEAQLGYHPEVPGLHLPAHTDDAFAAQWTEHRRADGPAFVVDAVEDAHMDRVATALLAEATRDRPALVVGSGGIMTALARAITGRPPRRPQPTRSSGPTFVVSASASATTCQQIDDAVRRGWVDIALPTDALTADDSNEGSIGPWVDEVEQALRAGLDVVAHTTRGPDDSRLSAGAITSAEVGHSIGRLAARMTKQGLTRDVVICGGDTSSHALLALDVGELRVREQFVTAGPICMTDDRSSLAGCRVLLKGGQVGPVDLFHQFAGPDRTPNGSHGTRKHERTS